MGLRHVPVLCEHSLSVCTLGGQLLGLICDKLWGTT